MQLFDEETSLADTVCSFLFRGHAAGNALLIVTTAARLKAIRRRLGARGVALEPGITSGRVVLGDSEDMLRRFMQDGTPDPERFDSLVGELVRSLAGRGQGLRVYGDMVDVLASEGQFGGAQQLEELWNVLIDRESFSLFCAYSAVHFGDVRNAEALRAICATHAQVRSNPRDLLGSFLARAHAQPARARNATR